ncbi:ArsR/SmtB family transcription factor [Nonomuraea aridisoli]|uniref:ArsR family transcriptional regulator n=1 Tax=Nonomuraea aridisoli TaxID=2070368 RepID=A0A2W2EUT8_9ACTN|nr:winged helix-turn-helix domain-containing protein [Nonomuraea aridisoli]PZG20085.1 ArsR family transcriptional regulator [Nonomuraea aridisoli]
MGTLRVHFTADDLARTTVAATVDPMWEILLSRFRLNDLDKAPAYQPWMRRLRSDPVQRANMRTGARLLTTLAPMGPYFPDFLTPAAARNGLEAGLEAIRSTPRHQLRSELQRLAQHVSLPGWVRSLADGEVAALTQLTDALRAYHQAAIAAHDDLIQPAVNVDRAKHVTRFLDIGVEGLLTSMCSTMRWRPPVLEVDYDIDQELHLGGQGLLLVPSFFCRRVPISLADPLLPPVLVYPINPSWEIYATEKSSRRPLETLIGSTRAAVLRAVGTGLTTTQLSRRLKISPASASRHAAVLREAGLITTVRYGAAVVHSRTALGTSLHEGCSSSDRPPAHQE